jgi:pyruvate/2-oxoglutarate/acetoin dehydrogenase E1 component
MPSVIVDGMDILAVKDAVAKAVKHARSGKGPMLIEAKTYRWYGHSSSDQRVYRTREEEAEWKARDPLTVTRKMLADAGLATEAELDAVMAQAEASIEESTKSAIESPFPDVSELMDDVFVPVDTAAVKAAAEAEKPMLATIHKAEDDIRAAVRKAANDSPKAVLPKLKMSEVKPMEEKHGMRVISYGQAVLEAQREEMARDESVFIMGEDVGLYGGAYAATKGLYDEFGPKRVIDTAISEAAIVGAAAGAAMRGTRPIAEIMYIDFLTISSDQLIHNASYNRYMFGGKTKVPCVVRTEGGVGRSIAAHHSESLEAMFMHCPGLYVVMPSTPYDAKGLLKSAIRDDNPVLFIEHKVLYSGVQGPVPDGEYTIPLGVADIKREGKHATIVAYCRMLHFALDAALELAKEGIEVEVIDPRTLVPFDIDTVANSVRKTGRLITVSEGFPKCGVASEIVRQYMDYTFADGSSGFDWLDAKPMMLAGKDCPVPMSEPLEDACVPTRDDIVAAVKATLK